MLDLDSLNLPALTTAHTRTKTTKQFLGQRTAQPPLRALLRNAAMDRTVSVKTGEVRAPITAAWPSRFEGEKRVAAQQEKGSRSLGIWPINDQSPDS